jgi:hypothetical protein
MPVGNVIETSQNNICAARILTRHDIAAESGRTYFFLARKSERSKNLMVVGAVSGLAGYAVASAVTSGVSNPGPLDFVPLDEATARTTIAELRLAE